MIEDALIPAKRGQQGDSLNTPFPGRSGQRCRACGNGNACQHLLALKQLQNMLVAINANAPVEELWLFWECCGFVNLLNKEGVHSGDGERISDAQGV